MIFSKNKSLVCFSPNPVAKRRLICFPCAGAGASMYRRWAQLLPEMEIWAANYPGRETLHSMPFASAVDDIIALLMEQDSVWRDKPVVLYGHSFGALVAFVAALNLQREGIVVDAVMVSARRAPFLPAAETYGDLSDNQFLVQLDRMGGVPAAIRNDPDMMAFYTPIIRADLQLNDTAQLAPAETIDSPLYLFSARYDRVASADELDAWKQCTRSSFTHRVFDGGHFFMQDDADGFTACIRSLLSGLQQDEEELIAF